MARSRKGVAAARPDLGLERIVDEALGLIQERGLAKLSMRELAARLSVYPSAIYWYVGSRNGLMAAMVKHVLADVLPDADESDWQQWVLSLMRSYRAAVMRHPNIAPLLGADLASNPGVDMRVVDRLLAVLERAGFRGDALFNAYNSVMAGMIGFVTLELSVAPADAAWVESMRSHFEKADPAEFPTISRLANEMKNRAFVIRWVSGHTAPLHAAYDAFIDALLKGLQAQLDMQTAHDDGSCRA